MQELTQAEEQVMQILWRIGASFVREIREEIPAPKPAYNTVSTIVRVLQKKGFVAHETFGRNHQYYPLISREEYRLKLVESIIDRFYDSSYKKFATYFSKAELSEWDLAALKQEIDEQLRKYRNQQPSLF